MVRISSKLAIIVLALLLLVIPALAACGGGDDDTVTAGGGDETIAPPDNDTDGDGVLNDADNCPDVANSDQADADGDGEGDACDANTCVDPDGDGACADTDNCPDLANADQADADNDGAGDACDVCPNDEVDDANDNDGICGDVDNCPLHANEDQADTDNDGVGDACDICPNDATDDSDGDTICDSEDTCPNDPKNDEDGDGVCGDVDNCPLHPNADQDPTVCESDWDADGVENDADNCPNTPNADQLDANGNGIGDACDKAACEGASWDYQVTYISDDPQRPEENTVTETATVTGTEDVDTDADGAGDVATFKIENEFSDVPLRYYYHADMGLTVPTDLSSPTVYRDETHKGIVKETFPLYANVMGGIDLAVDRLYVNYEGAPEELSVGATWTYMTVIDLPTFAVHIEDNWTAEVVGEEEVTVPLGTFNCYKVEKTKGDGCTNTEWWAVDEDFCTPVKFTYSCIFVGEETQELASYTAP